MRPTPRRLAAVAVCLVLLLPAAAFARPAETLRGVVVDPAGVPVAGAVASVSGNGWQVEARSDARGVFALLLPGVSDVQVVVRAPGFADAHLAVGSSRLGETLRVTLQLPAVAQQVTVTANRTEIALSQTPSDVLMVSRAALDATPALVLDETLRQVPGFTLFRRASSLAANPTSQGGSLRALGASGASRALVLDEGVPLNDPFGGWVYWDRVPSVLLERVEVVRGGASDLYGSGAISGVVNIVRRPAASPFLRLDASGGSWSTGGISLASGVSLGRWTFVGAGEGVRTEGCRSARRR